MDRIAKELGKLTEKERGKLKTFLAGFSKGSFGSGSEEIAGQGRRV